MHFDITPRKLIKRAFKDEETPTARAFGMLMAHSSSCPQLFELLQGLFQIYLKEKFRNRSSYLEFLSRVEARHKDTLYVPQAREITLARISAKNRGGSLPQILQKGRLQGSRTREVQEGRKP